jgi:hypothetical protein
MKQLSGFDSLRPHSAGPTVFFFLSFFFCLAIQWSTGVKQYAEAVQRTQLIIPTIPGQKKAARGVNLQHQMKSS